MKFARRVAKKLAVMLLTVLLGGFLAAVLVRMAPGADADERQIDFRLSPSSIASLRAERSQQRNVVLFYAAYMGNALRGDMGQSQSLNRPIRELVADRLPVSLKLAGFGLLLAWTAALTLAIVVSLARTSAVRALGAAASGFFLCMPAAVIALIFVIISAPASIALALVVFPRVYTYTSKLLARGYNLPHITTARAKGITELRVLFCHVFPVSAGPLIAIVAVSMTMALGALVPIEALCSIAGIGQLAWQAAMGRDLPLLVALTLIVSTFTIAANLCGELATEALSREVAA